MKSFIKTFSFLLCMTLVNVAMAQEFNADSKPMRINFKARDTKPPTIKWVYKTPGVLSAEGKSEVILKIVDAGGLQSYKINEVETPVSKMDSISIAMAFDPGQEVNVEATDLSSNVGEKSFTIIAAAPVLLTAATADSIHRPKYFALIMGVEEYEDPAINSLSEPIKDATLLKNALLSKYTFEEKNITFLKNPTFEQIDVAFEDLSNTIGPSDFLLIFYAGHGYFDEKTNIGYWLPSDAKKVNRSKWYRNSSLVENIRSINSRHSLLIADACFSGGIFKTRAPFNNASPDYAVMMKRPSRKAMTSGALTQVPDKSVFMKYLLRTLSENQNMYLSTEDLFDEIRIGMKNNAETKPLYGEIRDAGDDDGNFVFIQKNK